MRYLLFFFSFLLVCVCIYQVFAPMKEVRRPESLQILGWADKQVKAVGAKAGARIAIPSFTAKDLKLDLSYALGQSLNDFVCSWAEAIGVKRGWPTGGEQNANLAGLFSLMKQKEMDYVRALAWVFNESEYQVFERKIAKTGDFSAVSLYTQGDFMSSFLHYLGVRFMENVLFKFGSEAKVLYLRHIRRKRAQLIGEGRKVIGAGYSYY